MRVPCKLHSWHLVHGEIKSWHPLNDLLDGNQPSLSTDQNSSYERTFLSLKAMLNGKWINDAPSFCKIQQWTIFTFKITKNHKKENQKKIYKSIICNYIHMIHTFMTLFIKMISSFAEKPFLIKSPASLYKRSAWVCRCFPFLNEEVILGNRPNKSIFLIGWEYHWAQTWQKSSKSTDAGEKGFCLVDPKGFRIANTLSNCMAWAWTQYWKPISKYISPNEIFIAPDLAFIQSANLSGSQNHWPDLIIDYVCWLFSRNHFMHQWNAVTSSSKCGKILLAHNFTYAIIVKHSTMTK